MKELAALLDAIYRGFLLRDAFGKIVPGATFLVAAYVALAPTLSCDTPADAVAHLASVGLPTWALLGAFGWITAFAIQKLGEWTFRRDYGGWIPDDVSWYGKLIRFLEVAAPAEKAVFERFVVIKETCGNAAASFVLSAVLLLIPWHQHPMVWPVLGLLVGGVVLGFMHRVHADRQTRWLEAVLAFRGDRPYRGAASTS